MTPGKMARDRSVKMVDAVEVYESAIIVLCPAHSPSPVHVPETGLQRRRTPIKVTNMVVMVRPRRTKTAIRYDVVALAMR